MLETNNFDRGELGFVSYPQGEFRSISQTTSEYWDIGLTADGQTLAAVLVNPTWNIYLLPSAGGEARQLTAGQLVLSVSWTRDGKILSELDSALGLIDPANGSKSALPSSSDALIPSACRDGRNILFFRIGSHPARLQLWRMDLTDNSLQPLSTGQDVLYPLCSPDGKWAYYYDEQQASIMKAPMDGGPPSKVVSTNFTEFDFSANGKLLVYGSLIENKPGTYQRFIVSSRWIVPRLHGRLWQTRALVWKRCRLLATCASLLMVNRSPTALRRIRSVISGCNRSMALHLAPSRTSPPS